MCSSPAVKEQQHKSWFGPGQYIWAASRVFQDHSEGQISYLCRQQTFQLRPKSSQELLSLNLSGMWWMVLCCGLVLSGGHQVHLGRLSTSCAQNHYVERKIWKTCFSPGLSQSPESTIMATPHLWQLNPSRSKHSGYPLFSTGTVRQLFVKSLAARNKPLPSLKYLCQHPLANNIQ